MLRRFSLVLAIAIVAQAAHAELIVVRWERKGMKNPKRLVYGLDSVNGDIVWQKHVSEEVIFAERVSAGVLVGCEDGTLTLLDAATGETRWQIKPGGEKGEKLKTFRGAYADGYLVSDKDEALFFVNAAGKVVWTLK